ncbi:MAG: hypothetical protein KIS72_08285 [Luteimonas sp.]|nr:hypothetical protein [Luteimonas sp.]
MALAGLGDAARPRKGRLEVELADAWLRYLVIEWPAGVSGRAERAAWVTERFRSVHGAGAAEWVIGVDRGAVGNTALASAAPRALVEALTRFAADRQLRIVALHGSFVAAYNRLQARPSAVPEASCGALGMCRDGRLTVGLWARGQWRRVRSVQAQAGAGAVLGTTLAGWLPALADAYGEAGGNGVLHVLGVAPEALPPGWRVQAGEGAA